MSEPTSGRFVWHDLMTPDPEASQRFYSELLGWRYEIFKPGELDYPMVVASAGPIGGMMQLDAGQGAPPNWLGYVQVDDLDGALERVSAAGGAVHVPATPIPDVGRFAVVADPTRAALALMQPSGEPMAASQPTPGSVAWNELQSTDISVAAPFYAAVLGWEATERPMGEMVYTMFATNGADVAGGITLPPGVEAPSHWLAYFQVEDVDASLAQAGGLGATTLWGPFDVEGVGRMAGLLDPQGAVLAVWAPAAG